MRFGKRRFDNKSFAHSYHFSADDKQVETSLHAIDVIMR
jgi:hypothetical protein